ncbi:MAG: BNR-4 repeat-containing protein [Bryobacteraceae bacterium]|nr:BNR-4 repeat-containing protein [Bryobacteraceae bacterium]
MPNHTVAKPGPMMLFLLVLSAHASEPFPTAGGYTGIWYYNQPSNDEYVYKYSGGFATYPQQQSPIAIYARAVNKTFFCYGGTVEGKRELLHMVSYFDHNTGMAPRPTILLNKKTEDGHDNPVMSIDAAGHVWIFSNAHGTARPSYLHRSRKPYDISDFELVRTTNFSYGHPFYHPGKGFLFLHTLYENKGRSLYWTTSADGRAWEKPQLLARAGLGHYQVTAHAPGRTGSAFNLHPAPAGLNQRTNLYYVETSDMGGTWKTVDGRVLSVPVVSANNPALVHDYQADGLLVYLKEVAFDLDGHPVILYLTSRGYESGPKHGPRKWHTARWNGRRWEIRRFTTSDHNYDFGALWIEADGAWRVIAPTDPGPQPYTTGGDMVMWTSRNQGASWKREKRLTAAREFNHTYARKPVNAHPDFYALWADGDTKKPSVSHLYFTDRAGTAVWRLPRRMTGAMAKPERIGPGE